MPSNTTRKTCTNSAPRRVITGNLEDALAAFAVSFERIDIINGEIGPQEIDARTFAVLQRLQNAVLAETAAKPKRRRNQPVARLALAA